MMSEFVFEATHKVYYSNRDPVPVADVIDSLIGLDKLMRMTPKALEAITGIPIDDIEVFVEHIESGSLWEEMLVRFIFKDEEGLNAFIEKARQTVGDGPVRSVLIGAIVMALMYQASQWMADGSGGQTTNITANNNVIINLGAGEVNMTPEAFSAVVRSAVADRRELAKATQKVLKPLRRDTEASVSFDDNDVLVVTPDVVKEIPIEVEFAPDTRVEDMINAELIVCATNRDSLNSGWVVRLPLRFGQKKLKMKLDDGIDPESIGGKAQLVADVKIHYRRSESSKRYLPDYIELVRVVD